MEVHHSRCPLSINIGSTLSLIYDIVICCNIMLYADDTSLYVTVENPT